MRTLWILGMMAIVAGCTAQEETPSNAPGGSAASSSVAMIMSSAPSSTIADASFADPLPNALDRVTKKAFGTQVSPTSSPVTPEKFSGYHTGIDFEAFPEEADKDLQVSAVCTGNVRIASWIKGYGGVLIQDCIYRDQAVTVLYGHLNIDSVSARVGTTLSQGDQVGLLGKGYSPETDGERKHLHLSVHKGNAISYLGYVPQESQLSQWVNFYEGVKLPK